MVYVSSYQQRYGTRALLVEDQDALLACICSTIQGQQGTKMSKDVLMSWIDRLGTGGGWLYWLPLVIGVALVLVCLSMRHALRNGAEKKRTMAKKYEEYCRLYETGQREADDAGFCKYVQDRKNHDEFIRRCKLAPRFNLKQSISSG